MSALDHEAVAAEVDAAVREVSGVAALYRSGGIRLQFRDTDDALVLVEQNGEAVSVRASIGITGTSGAAVIARRAHTAVAKVLKRHGVAPAETHLTVVHID